MIRRVRRWGNSYGVRFTKADLERLGVREGAALELHVRPARDPPPIDWASAPRIEDPDPRLSHHIDRYLYGERPK